MKDKRINDNKKRSEVIFVNRMPAGVVIKATKSKERFIKKYGDDSNVKYPLSIVDNAYIGKSLGVKNIVIADDKNTQHFEREKGIIVGNIRIGFGHYRISMAIASAANALGVLKEKFLLQL